MSLGSDTERWKEYIFLEFPFIFLSLYCWQIGLFPIIICLSKFSLIIIDTADAFGNGHQGMFSALFIKPSEKQQQQQTRRVKMPVCFWLFAIFVVLKLFKIGHFFLCLCHDFYYVPSKQENTDSLVSKISVNSIGKLCWCWHFCNMILLHNNDNKKAKRPLHEKSLRFHAEKKGWSNFRFVSSVCNGNKNDFK